MAAAVERSHVATTLCHYGNISYRLGAKADLAAVRRATERMAGLPDFAGDLKTHLGVHGIDAGKPALTLGPWLALSGDALDRVESDRADLLDEGRFLLKETQRPPYRIVDEA